ncbi:MAG: mgrA [Planctomycetaceae bacterium]|nr:mgrA [Planctomycetaceae bacterium]
MPMSKLQQELKKQHPFDSLEQEAALNVIRTNDQLQLRFSRLFRDHGLTSSQYNILRILRGAGTPLPILEIAQRTITVVPGITGLIDRLEQAGFVLRNRCLEDRRVVYVVLTESGSQTVADLDQPVLDLHHKLFGHLEATELQTLNKILEKARFGLESQSE